MTLRTIIERDVGDPWTWEEQRRLLQWATGQPIPTTEEIQENAEDADEAGEDEK
jgi:hypothetical protein